VVSQNITHRLGQERVFLFFTLLGEVALLCFLYKYIQKGYITHTNVIIVSSLLIGFLLYLDKPSKIIGIIFFLLMFRCMSIFKGASLIKLISIPLLLLLLHLMNKEKIEWNLKNQYIAYYLIFLIMTCISALFTPNLSRGFKVLSHFIGPFVSGIFGYFMARYSLENHFRKAVQLLILTLLYITLTKYILSGLMNTNRLKWGSANANWIAAGEIIIISFFLYDFIFNKKKSSIPWIILTFLLLILTGSRSGVGASIIIMSYYSLRSSNSNKITNIFFICLLLIIGGYLVGTTPIHSHSKARAYKHLRTVDTSHRQSLLRDGIDSLPNMPLMGYGFGTWKYHGRRTNIKCHVMWLEMLLQIGWLGGLWFIFMCVKPLWSMWLNKTGLDDVDTIWNFYFITWLAFLLHANVHGAYQVNHYTWFLMASCYGFMDNFETKKVEILDSKRLPLL